MDENIYNFGNLRVKKIIKKLEKVILKTKRARKYINFFMQIK